MLLPVNMSTEENKPVLESTTADGKPAGPPVTQSTAVAGSAQSATETGSTQPLSTASSNTSTTTAPPTSAPASRGNQPLVSFRCIHGSNRMFISQSTLRFLSVEVKSLLVCC